MHLQTKAPTHPTARSVAAGLVFSASLVLPGIAGDPASAPTSSQGVQTELDIPGDSHKYFGQRSNQFRDVGRRLAKIDLDGDFNYDGLIDNEDPADNGAFQQTPPGLVVGTGELTRLVLRLSPYHLDFRGQAVVSMQVDGVNRADKTGRFASLEEEMASVGHVRVWRDPSKRELILDSRDPGRRVYEWTIDDSKYPANIPGIVPRTLYLEGVDVAGAGYGGSKEGMSAKGGLFTGYSGDVRLLVTVFHRVPGEEPVPVYDDPKAGLGAKGGVIPVEPEKDDEWCLPGSPTRFRTSYDHILVTVRRAPHRKEFVADNVAGVWSGRSEGTWE